MSKILPKKIKPVNRHIAIVPHFVNQEENKSNVLLPEGFEAPKDKYVLATVLDVASDCGTTIRGLSRRLDKTIIVDRAMIEEIEVNDKKHYVVLENYVVGVLRDFNESN